MVEKYKSENQLYQTAQNSVKYFREISMKTGIIGIWHLQKYFIHGLPEKRNPPSVPQGGGREWN